MTDRPRTLGELKASGYKSVSVKDEMRRNLIAKIRRGESLFPGILGYEETVVPQIQNAILSRHDILLLGLRGQAKTRMLRQLVQLLDDAVPVVAGSELNDDPLHPISMHARDLIRSQGDAAPIEWMGRDARYQEKLATPDVTIADLIGEIDMIKHAEGRYLSSEAVMHYGLVPRTNRGIFCINELPDLSPKIQVGLFNVLEERDVQIRGFPIRLNLDLCMVFSANPEDYTNRGRIVTPLKDRIGSVVRTHYPLTRDLGVAISDDNAWTKRDGTAAIFVPRYIKHLVEEASRLARTSPHVNQQSGVSVRMSIANLENIVSSAERRALLTGEPIAVPRVSDLAHLSASSRGKLELTMSEDEGSEDKLMERIRAEAVKNIFDEYADVKSLRPVVEQFDAGRTIELGDALSAREIAKRIDAVSGLKRLAVDLARKLEPDLKDDARMEQIIAGAAELILDGLHAHNRLNKNQKPGAVSYRR